MLRDVVANTFEKWDQQQARWKEIVDQAPTLFEFLNNMYVSK
jgi:F0F1-type ATP synthase delta subunit